MSRSIWKGPFCSIEAIALRKTSKIASSDLPALSSGQQQKQESATALQNIFIWSRSSMILPKHVDRKVQVYNGKAWIRRTITEQMVGHKFGEFSYTKKKTIHKANKIK